jgi:hypothetical protein
MDWDKNDYETPNREADLMAKLVLPTDKRILEPFAGTGQLIEAILRLDLNFYWDAYGVTMTMPDFVYLEANELNSLRFKQLVKKFHEHRQRIYNNDFFTTFTYYPECQLYDLIITNPPFDHAMKGIKHSLALLNDKPESRLLFLLPLSFFSSQGRSKEFNKLDCHIAGISIIPWRIDYLKDGIPMSKCQKEVDGVPQYKNDKPVMCSGRQEYDAVFCIKKGKKFNSPINFLG